MENQSRQFARIADFGRTKGRRLAPARGKKQKNMEIANATLPKRSWRPARRRLLFHRKRIIGIFAGSLVPNLMHSEGKWNFSDVAAHALTLGKAAFTVLNAGA